jgi:hypothetical protein
MTDRDYPAEHLLVDEHADLLRAVMTLPGGALFTQNGDTYFVTARPALPHETDLYFSRYAWSSTPIHLPFACEY